MVPILQLIYIAKFIVPFEEFSRVPPIISDIIILYSKMVGACKLALEVQAEFGPTA